MSTAAAPSLESIVAQYQREAARAAQREGKGHPSSVELEVRFRNVDFPTFESILAALVAKKVAVDDGTIVRTVDSIMVERARGKGAAGSAPDAPALKPQRIRQIAFKDGKKASDRYVFKSPLAAPWKNLRPFALSFIVALSSEAADDIPFSSDEGAIVRAKARVSFVLAIPATDDPKRPLTWRVELTVVRQITGADVSNSLPGIITEMFRTSPAMTPANMLEVLRVGGAAATAARRQLFQYEIECEFVPATVKEAAAAKGPAPADVLAVADAIIRLADPEYVQEAAHQEEIFHVAGYVVKAPGLRQRFEHELGLKRLLPQVVALTRSEYKAIYPPLGFFLTDKPDGVRALASVRAGRARVLERALHEFAPADPLRPGADPERRARLTLDTIADCEAVVGADGKLKVYLFDTIALKGRDVTEEGFEKRVGYLPTVVEILQEFGVDAAVKPFVHLSSKDPELLRGQVLSVSEAKRAYETDGLILIEPGQPYAATKSYKWKALKHNTIDFIARRCPSSVAGKTPFVPKAGHTLYFLFVGINPDFFAALGLVRCPGYAELWGDGGGASRVEANTGSYFPVQFAPSDCPLAYLYQHPNGSPLGDIDKKVVEGRCRGNCLAAGAGSPTVDWELARIREDRTRDLQTRRYYGNDYRIAEFVWQNYLSPFPEDQLWNGPTTADYFSAPKAGIHFAPTAFISFVKNSRILTLRDSKWVADLGAGRGQDLGRYLDAGVRNLVCVDRDREALAELVRRKYSHAERRFDKKDQNRHRGARGPSTAVHIAAVDISQPAAETVGTLRSLGAPIDSGVDAVVANLMVHYLLSSVESADNVVVLCRSIVKVGGQVIITAFMGDKIHELFTENKIESGQSWDVHQDDSLKYSLKREYSSAKLEKAGQKIGVLLPFSDGSYYEENLVNMSALTSAFEARGFKRTALVPFSHYLNEFRVRNQTVYDQLTADDKKYVSLYGELVLTREK